VALYHEHRPPESLRTWAKQSKPKTSKSIRNPGVFRTKALKPKVVGSNPTFSSKNSVFDPKCYRMLPVLTLFLCLGVSRWQASSAAPTISTTAQRTTGPSHPAFDGETSSKGRARISPGSLKPTPHLMLLSIRGVPHPGSLGRCRNSIRYEPDWRVGRSTADTLA